MMSAERDVINTRIWEDIPEADNPFAAAACYCSGYDVYASLVKYQPEGATDWLQTHRAELDAAANCPLTMTGVAAAAFIDLGFSVREGEMRYLPLRLPGAAAHALEQEDYGWRRYPFFGDGLKLQNDPGPVGT